MKLQGMYRIETAAGGKGGAGQDDYQEYLKKLMMLIPAEVIGLYLIGIGFIPPEEGMAIIIWASICLVGVIAVRLRGTSSSVGRPQYGTVALSTLAFVVWVYTMGGPFVVWDFHTPYIGSLAVLVVTFFAPLLPLHRI